MAKQLLNVMPLEGNELPFLRRGGSGEGSGGSAGAGGDYNVESVDNGDGTQTLQITDATGGGASGSSESPFFYVKWNYNEKLSLAPFLILSTPASCIFIINNQIFSYAILKEGDVPESGEIICKCIAYTAVVNVEGQIMKMEVTAEVLQQQYPDIQIITEAEWNAEYNRILNL